MKDRVIRDTHRERDVRFGTSIILYATNAHKLLIKNTQNSTRGEIYKTLTKGGMKMAEEIKNDEVATMSVQLETQRAQERLTGKLIELINLEFKVLLTEDLEKVFKNVRIWMESEEEQIAENLKNFKGGDDDK